MRKKLIIIMFTLLATIAWAGQHPALANTPDSGEYTRKIPLHAGKSYSIRENVKPVDLSKAQEKVEELGQEAYELLQNGSILLLVVGMFVSVCLMLLGIIFRFMLKVGLAGVAITFLVFGIVNFAPELAGGLIEMVQSWLRAL